MMDPLVVGSNGDGESVGGVGSKDNGGSLDYNMVSNRHSIVVVVEKQHVCGKDD